MLFVYRSNASLITDISSNGIVSVDIPAQKIAHAVPELFAGPEVERQIPDLVDHLGEGMWLHVAALQGAPCFRGFQFPELRRLDRGVGLGGEVGRERLDGTFCGRTARPFALPGFAPSRRAWLVLGAGGESVQR